MQLSRSYVLLTLTYVQITSSACLKGMHYFLLFCLDYVSTNNLISFKCIKKTSSFFTNLKIASLRMHVFISDRYLRNKLLFKLGY